MITRSADWELLLPEMLAQAAAEAPNECCGLVVVEHGRLVYRPTRNISANPPKEFTIHPEDYAAAEDAGEILRVVHSHIGIPPQPSQADRVACEASGLPWTIVNQPAGTWFSFEPEGYKAPLIGREFTHGVLDCYALVRDYYQENCGILLNNYPRKDQWWNEGQDLYRDYFMSEGFVQVTDDLRIHDSLLIQFSSPVPNHAAVYIGDGLIMHHVQGRLSSRDVYGGYWRKYTAVHLRHESLC